jgi:putative phosphoesterase
VTISKIGIIGDVHCEDARLEKVLDFFKQNGLDEIVCAGDVADGAGNLERVIELLKTYNVKTVRGNHDRWLLNNEMRELENSTILKNVASSDLEFLKNLPRTIEVSTTAGRLMICHGILENDMNKINPTDEGYAVDSNEDLQKLLSMNTPFVINGHSHRRMVRKFGNCTIINAGTLDRRHEPCCGIVDFATKKVQFYLFGPDNKLNVAENFNIE